MKTTARSLKAVQSPAASATPAPPAFDLSEALFKIDDRTEETAARVHYALSLTYLIEHITDSGPDTTEGVRVRQEQLDAVAESLRRWMEDTAAIAQEVHTLAVETRAAVAGGAR